MAKKASSRTKIVYQEWYKKPYPQVKPEFLPVIRHTEGLVVSAEIRTLGQIEVNGETLDFQDLRVYLRFPRA